LAARNTLVQLSALYINPQSHNAQCHRRADGQTDGKQNGQMLPRADHNCVAVRSANKNPANHRNWLNSTIAQY